MDPRRPLRREPEVRIIVVRRHPGIGGAPDELHAQTRQHAQVVIQGPRRFFGVDRTKPVVGHGARQVAPQNRVRDLAQKTAARVGRQHRPLLGGRRCGGRRADGAGCACALCCPRHPKPSAHERDLQRLPAPARQSSQQRESRVQISRQRDRDRLRQVRPDFHALWGKVRRRENLCQHVTKRCLRGVDRDDDLRHQRLRALQRSLWGHARAYACQQRDRHQARRSTVFGGGVRLCPCLSQNPHDRPRATFYGGQQRGCAV